MNDYAEIWDEICFLLSDNIKQSLSERDFENQVVRSLEVLGWREFKNEIQRQPSIQLGREGVLRPDLIIYDEDKKPLIVVEVKRPVEDISKDYVIGQLRSYMRQIKSDFGFLIGSDLRVFYDGQENPYSDPILLEKIEFKKQIEQGIAFVELFNKESMKENKYIKYLKDKLHKFNKKKEVNSLIHKLTSFEIKQKIIGFLRNEYPDTDDETFSEALQKINIQISQKVEHEQKTITENTREKTFNKDLAYRSKKYVKSQTNDKVISSEKIAMIPFESHLERRFRHIYGVLYYLNQNHDFPSATHQTLKLFPEVKDYQTISDACARRFAGKVDTFVHWFQTKQILSKLREKLDLSDNDYKIFKKLLSDN